MIDPVTLKETIMEATAAIPDIRRREIVATDDEFVDVLGELKTGDNLLLVAVLPAYGGFGQQDQAGVYSYMQFFVLQKVDYKALKNRDEYVAVFQRTLAAAVAFVRDLFGISALNCSAEQLQYDYQIRPISRKAQCNGYEIQIDSRAFTDYL